MKTTPCSLLALPFLGALAAAAGTSGSRAAAQVTPVQKVIELLQGMAQKGKDERQAEQVQFRRYKQFCEDTSIQKQKAIDRAEETRQVLLADIETYTAEAARLGKEIAAHDEDIAVWNGDVKAVKKVRDMGKATYDATHKDLTESVDALQQAIEVMKKQAYNRKQAEPEEASLAQLSAVRQLSLIPAHAKKAIDAFLSQDPQVGLDVSAPEAHGYAFQSQGVIDLLEKLLDKFSAERLDLENAETTAVHEFEMLMADLKRQTADATQDRSDKAAMKAKKLQAKADAEGSLQDTTTTRDADKQYLSDLVATCEQKAEDYESRQTLRAEELVAIEKATKIISSGAVSGHADTHLPGLLQAGTSLAALRADLQGRDQARAAAYLRNRAREIESRVLAAVAQRVADDPFAKVKKMIKDLLVRLMEEANEEAEHKGWCDKELSTNEQTRKIKTAAVETLHAEIDQLEASIAKLGDDVKELTKDVAELTSEMAKATKLRAEEKEKNEKTIADAKEAQMAVAKALTVLNEFYAKAGEATALLQRGRQQPEAPEIFDSPYKGMQGESGGVVGMLEVIQSDFARLESDTQSSEAAAQKEYDTFMEDSKVDKAAKTQDIEHKTTKKQSQEQALVQKKADLEGNQKELDAAIGYFDKLKPSCIDSGSSFEATTKRRKEELESLRKALQILNGEDMA